MNKVRSVFFESGLKFPACCEGPKHCSHGLRLACHGGGIRLEAAAAWVGAILTRKYLDFTPPPDEFRRKIFDMLFDTSLHMGELCHN
jgi:hypothetical protein